MSSPKESPSDLWLEHSNFLGCALGAIAYGFFATLYFITTYRILRNWCHDLRRTVYLAYTFVLFAVTTVNVAMSIRWNMITFIDNRNYPGGPLAFSLVEVPELIVGNVTYILSNFLTDLLVLFRCSIVWQDRRVVIVLPILMFIASTVLSILMVYQSARPGANFWSTSTANFALPYWAMTISLNVVVTLLISGRLLGLRKQVHEVLGEYYARKYTSAIAMVVESAALYTVSGMIFLVTFARNSYVQNLMWPLLTSFMPAAPMLILLRVASGDGFSNRYTTAQLALGELSKLSFQTRPPATTTTTTTPSDISIAEIQPESKKEILKLESNSSREMPEQV